MIKKNKKTLFTILGLAALGGGIWYFTRPEPNAPIIPTTPSAGDPNFLPPAGSTPPFIPTDPATIPGTYPVVTGAQAKVGDKLWASVTPATVYKNVNPGTATDQQVNPGHYAGQVIDASPAAFIKVRMFSGAPYYDGGTHTDFYLSKARIFTVRN